MARLVLWPPGRLRGSVSFTNRYRWVGKILTNLEIRHPLAAFEDDAGRLVAEDAVSLHHECSNPPSFPKVNVGTAHLLVCSRFTTGVPGK